MLGSSRAKPLADLVRFEAIKKDEAAVARADGGDPVGSKRLPAPARFRCKSGATEFTNPTRSITRCCPEPAS